MNANKEKTKFNSITEYCKSIWTRKKPLEEVQILSAAQLSSQAKEKRWAGELTATKVANRVHRDRYSGIALYADFPVTEENRKLFWDICKYDEPKPDEARAIYHDIMMGYGVKPSNRRDTVRFVRDRLVEAWSSACWAIGKLESAAKDSVAAAQLYAKEGEIASARDQYWKAASDYSTIADLYLRFGDLKKNDKQGAEFYQKLASEQSALGTKYHGQVIASQKPSAY